MGLFVCDVRADTRWGREDRPVLALAAAITLFVLAFKLIAYFTLAYTDDLFVNTQLATSWLEGHPLRDHHYGNHLSIHTFFLILPLALFARPLGPPGLLLALALGAGLSCVLAARVLARLGVAPRRRAAYAAALVLAPISLHNFHDPIYGFHLELLAPPLALGLLEALLRRSLRASLVWASLLLLVKEELPLLTGAIAALVLVEDRLAPSRRGWNRPALFVLALALVSLPVLLAIMKLASSTGSSVDAFSRLRHPELRAAGVRSGGALALFVLEHPASWLGSTAVRYWLLGLALGSFGLVALRPHVLVLGLPLTVTAWLMDDSILWPPRFAPSLAFAWCTGLLGLGSLERLLEGSRPRRTRAALALVSAATVALGLAILPAARELYLLSPSSPYAPDERRAASELFRRYAVEARPGEAVVATQHLHGHSNSSDLHWWYALPPGTRPVWVLWDDRATPIEELGLPLAGYELLGRSGRFSLYRRR